MPIEQITQNYKLDRIFSFLIIYYWGMLYIKSPTYIALTLPIALYVIYMLSIYILNFSVFNRFSFILLFVLTASYLSLIRSDLTSLIAVMLFGLMIFFIIHFKLTIKLQLLNRLFIISILLSVPLYYSGYSYYGFLPGQGGFSNDAFLSGRVSLFPNVTVSIYFSFIIFFINYFFNKNSLQKITIFLFSLYFIYFGISRTVMLGILFIMLFSSIFRIYPIQKSIFYQLFLPFFLIIVPIGLILFIEDIIEFLINLNNEFISEYFLRNLSSVEKVLDDIARTNIWSEHIRLFKEHPWGLSTVEIERYTDPSLHLSDGGSESFLTKILVRFGFASFFFYLFIMSLLFEALKEQNEYKYVFSYIFIFIGVTYGSFFAAYNALFLIFISSLNYEIKEVR